MVELSLDLGLLVAGTVPELDDLGPNVRHYLMYLLCIVSSIVSYTITHDLRIYKFMGLQWSLVKHKIRNLMP